ncbi:MAG: SAF domain-containing protein [Eubacteriales bacterium]|nr:SAF domain-containing protein [Eubacteriales bacterium]MDD4389330.1 SAF domain-containing protein [Eubacteriales bacterium]
MKFNAAKSILGVILIIASLGGLFYWETTGRIKWTMIEVSAAAVDINPGVRITKNMIKTITVPKEELVSRAITSISHNLLEVGRAKQFIPENAQLSAVFFETAKESIEKGKTLFQIDSSWIGSRSSTLRGGDNISIYSGDGELKFGSFKTAFVKDEKEAEVTDGENGEIETELLNRRNSTNRISHIEIWAELPQYEQIRNFALSGGDLLIMQGMEADGE